MSNMHTQRQVCLMNQFRKLWTQHVYWTRFFIISTAANLGDLELVTNRLLQNPGDFACQFARFYTNRTADRFKDLFTQHLTIAADLVNAAKNGETAKANNARQKWYENADEIAEFLSCINPYWSKSNWTEMMYEHLKMTEREATLRLGGEYAKDIAIFDSIEEQALKMADYMSCGIIKQFRFR